MNHQEIINEIEVFEKELSTKHNCNITLHFSINKYSLEKIKVVTNKVFKKSFEGVTSIEDRTRKKFYVLFRAIYYKVANEYGFTLEKSGEHIGFDHSTASQAIAKLELRLAKDSIPVTKYYNEIKTELENLK